MVLLHCYIVIVIIITTILLLYYSTQYCRFQGSSAWSCKDCYEAALTPSLWSQCLGFRVPCAEVESCCKMSCSMDKTLKP